MCLSGLFWRVWGSSYLGGGVVHGSAIVTDDLTVSGPYRYTRNPLYLGLSLYALGIAMLGPPLTVAIVFIGIDVLQYALIFSEERHLRERFGERYDRYVIAVPRMLPSPRPRVPDSGIHPSVAIGLRSEAYVLLIAVASFAFALSRGR